MIELVIVVFLLRALLVVLLLLTSFTTRSTQDNMDTLTSFYWLFSGLFYPISFKDLEILLCARERDRRADCSVKYFRLVDRSPIRTK